jgi:hypothetical protein
MGLSLGALVLGTRSAYAAVTVESFSAASASTRGGAHADFTNTFAFRRLNAPGGSTTGPLTAGGNPRDIRVQLPPGLVGNLNNVPRCPRALFDSGAIEGENTAARLGCPADTQVGLATLYLNGSLVNEEETFGVFNVQPGPTEPALLGIEGQVLKNQGKALIHVTASARDNYALTATVLDVQQFPLEVHLLGASVTLWAVPGAHERDDSAANWTKEHEVHHDLIPPEAQSARTPFMENPTDCSQTQLTELLVDTFEEPEVWTTAMESSLAPSDCADVPFAPSISLTPDLTQAGAPTGLSFDLTLPQSNDPNGRGTSELEKAVVTLPAGMTLSPSAASQLLEGCTDEQFAAGADTPAQCPAASVIGEDEVESPLLPQNSSGGEGELTGRIFLGQPLSSNPQSGQMFRIFQELKGYGLDVKLQGSVTADPQTGQLTATFANLPELPFQTFRLHFKGGPNAVLTNPSTCGLHTFTSQLFPYSDPSTPATPSSSLETSYDGEGASCPSTLPFSPSSSISTANSQAGALSPLTVSFSRPGGNQPLGQLDIKLPAGLLAYVSKAQLCEASAALTGTCSPESRIGTVTASAGAGEDPLTVGGSVYLAHGSDGYPFMLSVVVPAVAGPYDLGNVTVPVWLQVNSDGSLTAISGGLPSILDGIPLDIRSVTMSVDRPGFAVNPTNCAPLTVTGTATALSGATAPLSAPFAVSGCASLPFAPSFTAATQGSTSKANGASLTVRVSQGSGEADIRVVHVELPKSLPSRDSTLNKACTEKQFAANPAGCPAGSFVGAATAYTPLLPVPVSGPAILVSHAAAAFPDLDIILQGDGVTIDLVGNTSIKKGVTSSTFASVPDVPISGFELKLPEGPYSIFAANGKPCEQKLLMPTTMTGQNGIVVKQNTRIVVSGCLTPSLKLISSKVKRASASLTLEAPAAGRLVVSGPGLKQTRRMLRHAGNITVGVVLTRAGLSSLHSHHRLTATLKASFMPSSGSSSALSTTLAFR